MRELFIYYRSREDHAAAVPTRVRSFQARLVRAHPGLVARLLRRPVVKDGLITWMETYAIDPMSDCPGIDERLQQEIEFAAAPLRGLIEGERHVEVFRSCAC
jgi:hypothetical protein